MKTTQSRLVAIAVLVVLSWGSGPVRAQSCFPFPIPWPDGCSVHAPLWIQNGLDNIFWGACTQHDLCYAAPNAPYGPCRGYGWKAGCDATLGASMEATCIFYAGVLSFPSSGWIDADDFLDDCSYVAAAFYAAVSLFGFPAFESDQCCLGCNTNMCINAGLPLPFFCGPPSCGTGGGGPGGGGGCGGGYVSTQVVTLDLQSGRVRRSDPPTHDGLMRTVNLDGKSYFQEEWVLTETGGTGATEVLRSASPRAIQQLAPGALTPAEKTAPAAPGRRFLVVEAARHREGRMPPLVKQHSLVTGVLPSGPLADGRVTFRATFSPAGVMDGVEVIEGDPATAQTLAADLQVEFPRGHGHDGAAYEPHRSIVFASFEVKDGDAWIISAVPILPQCCCGTVHCV